MKIFTILLSMLLVLSIGAQQSKKIVLDGSTTVGPIAKAFAEYYMKKNPQVKVSVSESGSGNGAKSLINGSCQIATMSRFMKNTEFEAAVSSEVFPVFHVIAFDGVPILVHPSNPIKNLTLDQIRDIYTGKITNWKQVGGPDQQIVIISRDTNSGTYETFETIVMKGEKIVKTCEYVGSNGAIRQRVQSTPAAIGYAGVAFIDKTVKAVEVNGVYPTPETIKSGKYPIARPLFFVTNGYPKLGSEIFDFINIYLTKDGQAMIEEIGFVPPTNY